MGREWRGSRERSSFLTTPSPSWSKNYVCQCVCVCVEGGREDLYCSMVSRWEYCLTALIHFTHTEHGLQKLFVLKQGSCQVDNTIEIVPKGQFAILRLGDREHTGDMGSRTRRGRAWPLLCLRKHNMAYAIDGPEDSMQAGITGHIEVVC